ncbi:uncharacterized protein [Drosophila tropicalis]|uniref:uncharacterized protein n=1 Tax=Drosophila tropicalis TaxID=46794 RepID=UPI0035AB96EC
MAEGKKSENEENWLYGGEKLNLPKETSELVKAQHVVCSPRKKQPESELTEFDDPAKEMEEDEEALMINSELNMPPLHGHATVSDGDEDSEDDVNVVIRHIHPTSNVRQLTNLLTCPSVVEKAKPSAQAGQFSVADFQGIDETINEIPAHEFSIDSLEEKPWRKPGSDITDYFNYGFNEMTWRAYCERQKHMRITESGAGMISLTQNPYNNVGLVGVKIEDTTMQMPPGTTMQPSHLAMGMGMQRSSRPIAACKEQVIKVLTAESRHYTRMNLNFPPPPPGVTDDAYLREQDSFDYGYGEQSNWMPTSIKQLTPSNELQMLPESIDNSPPTQVNMSFPHQMMMQDEDQKPIREPSPRPRVPLGINDTNSFRKFSSSSSYLTVSKDGSDDNKRNSRRPVKYNEPKRESSSFQLRKNFLDMLSERQDINNNTRWNDIKKKLRNDQRYRALDSVYREEYFRDYLHIIIREGKRKRGHKERHRQNSSSSSSTSKRQGTRSWSMEKISYSVASSRKNT